MIVMFGCHILKTLIYRRVCSMQLRNYNAVSSVNDSYDFNNERHLLIFCVPFIYLHFKVDNKHSKI